jgi:hypothetical protein
VQRVLAAETAVLVELKTIGVVLLVLEGVVVSLLAFGAGQSDLNAHCMLLLKYFHQKRAPNGGTLNKLPQRSRFVNEKVLK